MKRHAIKLLIASFLLLTTKIGNSGAYFTSQVSSNNISMSTGCWAAPSVPVLVSPPNNSNFGKDSDWTKNPIMDWNNSTSSCPLDATIQYYYESYSDEHLIHQVYHSLEWLNDSQIPASGTPEGTYFWRVKSRDNHGNESVFSTPWKLTVDTTKPESVITTPQIFECSLLFNCKTNDDNKIYIIRRWDGKLAGTASDNLSGVNRVELSIHREILNLSWNGDSWVYDPNYLIRVPAIGTNNWTFSFKNRPEIGDYKITSHAIDNAGNIENSFTIIFENAEEEIVTPTIGTSISDDRHYYSFAVGNTADFSKLSYEVIYDTDEAPKGFKGEVNLDNQNEFKKDNILLGSQSAGGGIAYDSGVKNIKIAIILTRPDGTTLTLDKTDN